MTNSRHIWPNTPEGYLRIAIGGAFVVFFFKVYAYFTGGGAGLLSDSTESLLNILTALMGLYGVLWAQRPRDVDHPYGHGKVDSLISGIQALLVASAAGALAYVIFQGKYRPVIPEAFIETLGYEGSAIALNGAIALLLRKGSKRFHSQILRAESWHLLSDVATSLIVLVGLTAVWAGLPSIVDKGIGLLMVVFIGYGAFQILRETGAALIDTQDPRLLHRLAEAIEKNHRPEWIDIHNVRIQRYGHALHIDGHITFPWYWSLREAHEALKELETFLRQELHRPVEFFWHMDPCEPVCCSYCELQGCMHRQQPFREKLHFTPGSLFVNTKGMR
ncbi:MAG: cation diffusion facilitator family transporter [Bacteroidia bacterium]|nr:cation diffusion facilitator family transporter [Bacteroidia bacterium]